MSSYAKLWTDIFGDDWFLSLKAHERGVFIQLIIYAKHTGDIGRISASNWTHMGSILGCDGKTCRKILGNFLENGKIVTVDSSLGLCFDIPKYHYNQHVRKPSDKKTKGNFPEKSPKIREDKIRQNNIIDIVPFEEIISDLNSQAKTKFRHTAEATKKSIQARWAEGHRLDDFKYVHKIKVAEWKGTDYAKYLRPGTLYGTKFESYLNQQPETPKHSVGHTTGKTKYGKSGSF